MRFLTLALLFSGIPSHTSAREILVPMEHQTIQNAIDDAAPGDVVLVSAGTYREHLSLKAGVVLRSEGDDSKSEPLGLKRARRTIIDSGGHSRSPGVLMAEGAILDGFTVTRVGSYNEEKWSHHHRTQGNEQHHEDIGLSGVPAISVDGVTCEVRNNIVHHNGHTGIGIQGKKDRKVAPLVWKNVVFRNMGGGIGSMNGSTAVIRENRCFENFHAGIGHHNASPTVSANICYGNIRAGIGISGGSSPVVQANKCYQNRRAGIGIRTGKTTRPLVEDNDCYENGMAGIGSEDQAAPVIRGNRCFRNSMAGIGSRNGASPLIIGNECFENEQAGIGCDGVTGAVIMRNTSRRNKTAGIGIRGEKTGATVIHNQCLENKLVALGIPDGATVTVLDNEFKRTGGQPPLIAIRGGSKVVFARNKLSGGGVAGILLQGQAQIEDNLIEKAGNGVWVWDGSDAVVRNNRIVNCRSGISASGSQLIVESNHIEMPASLSIVIKNPKSPPVVRNNISTVADPEKVPIQVDGADAIISGNTVKGPGKPKEK